MRKKILILISLLTLFSASFGQSYINVNAPVFDGGTTQVRAPNGLSSYAYLRASQLVLASELTKIPVGTTIHSLGFSIQNGTSPDPVTGNMIIYLQNSSDVTFSKGSVFSTIITGMTSVYNGNLTLPASNTPTTYTITLTTPFVYTGGSIYVAYDWYSPGPYSGTPVTYFANYTGLAMGSLSANSAAAPPTILGLSNYRPVLIWGIPEPAAALSFDGTNDFVNIGTSMNSILHTLNKITVESWVKPNTNTGLGVIVGNYNTYDGGMQFLLRRDDNCYGFYLDDGSGYKVIKSQVGSVNIGVWQHIVGVWDGTSISIYIDGVLQGTTAGVTGSSMATSPNPIYLGHNNINENFNGSIDEVRIWSVARTRCEINSYKNCQIPTTAAGLLANYHFNQGFDSQVNSAETSLTDYSGNAFTGTLYNFALSGTNSNWIAPGGVVSDSITPANLNTTSSTSIVACDSYFWNGTTYTTSGTRTYVTENNKGCDSTATLLLTINNSNTGDTTVSTCDQFTWYGITYTASANPTHTFTNAAGCDSVVTLHLSINNNTGDTTAVACNSFNWFGTTYTTSGNPTHVFTNAAGCDSTVTLHLTINFSNTGDTTAVACDSFYWYGTTYYSSAFPTHVFTNMNNCDSLVTLNLTIETIDLSVSVNGNTIIANQAGASYQWIDCSTNLPIAGETNQDFTISASGLYAVIVSLGACSDTSACQNMIYVGLGNNHKKLPIKVFPNPASNMLFVSNITQETILRLYDNLGKQLFVQYTSEDSSIDISMFSPGVYTLTAEDNDGKTISKIIISR